MSVTLDLHAENPADVADLINQVLTHSRSEHALRFTDDGDIRITAVIHADAVPPAGPEPYGDGHPAEPLHLAAARRQLETIQARRAARAQ